MPTHMSMAPEKLCPQRDISSQEGYSMNTLAWVFYQITQLYPKERTKPKRKAHRAAIFWCYRGQQKSHKNRDPVQVLCMALGKRHGRKDRSSKNRNVEPSWSTPEFYRTGDPAIVHYTESSLRDMVLYLFLNLRVPYSQIINVLQMVE